MDCVNIIELIHPCHLYYTRTVNTALGLAMIIIIPTPFLFHFIVIAERKSFVDFPIIND